MLIAQRDTEEEPKFLIKEKKYSITAGEKKKFLM